MENRSYKQDDVVTWFKGRPGGLRLGSELFPARVIGLTPKRIKIEVTGGRLKGALRIVGEDQIQKGWRSSGSP